MKRGRKTTFNAEMGEKILAVIREGVPPTRAGESCGVARSTLQGWMSANPEFAADVKRAEGECERRCLRIVDAAAPKSWQAAAWLLERRFDYKVTQRTELTGGEGGPVALQGQTINLHVLATLAQDHERRVRRLEHS